MASVQKRVSEQRHKFVDDDIKAAFKDRVAAKKRKEEGGGIGFRRPRFCIGGYLLVGDSRFFMKRCSNRCLKPIFSVGNAAGAVRLRRSSGSGFPNIRRARSNCCGFAGSVRCL